MSIKTIPLPLPDVECEEIQKRCREFIELRGNHSSAYPVPCLTPGNSDVRIYVTPMSGSARSIEIHTRENGLVSRSFQEIENRRYNACLQVWFDEEAKLAEWVAYSPQFLLDKINKEEFSKAVGRDVYFVCSLDRAWRTGCFIDGETSKGVARLWCRPPILEFAPDETCDSCESPLAYVPLKADSCSRYRVDCSACGKFHRFSLASEEGQAAA